MFTEHYIVLPDGRTELLPGGPVPDVPSFPIDLADSPKSRVVTLHELQLWGDIVNRMDSKQLYECRGLDDDQGGRYKAMRLDGQSHNMAIVLAARRFPGINTDSTFNEGRCNGNQFETVPLMGDHYRRIALAHGVNPVGMHYASGLASFPGDPTAWINNRGDVARIAAQKGLSVAGSVNYKAPESAPSAEVEIDEDLLTEEMADIDFSDPGVRREDVREELRALRTGRVDPNPLRVTDHNFEGTA